jgi:hypothetical protein
MQFGPLSSEGGERRLNVLISRAKRRCEVFASITDEDIDLERGRGKGVAALKLFLNFARTGRMSIGQLSEREATASLKNKSPLPCGRKAMTFVRRSGSPASSSI